MNETYRNWQRTIGFQFIISILLCVVVIVLFGFPLFLSAGSLYFPNAWLFLSIIVTAWFLIFIYLAIKDPSLFEKRTTMRKEERSQTTLKLLLTCTLLGALIISGLDYRYTWSYISVYIVGFFAFVVMAGNIMLFLVMRQNTFGSRVIEIQKDQKVIDTGMYSIVRHPMYLAFSIIFGFSPLVLGSYYALTLSIFMPILIAIRIRREETLLKKDLVGYISYMQKVKCRLIPFVW